MDEWIFQDNRSASPTQEVPEIVPSLTPNAVQKDWKTPSEFPYCPQLSTNSPIATYGVNLKIGAIFSRNQYSTTIIIDFTTSKDEDTLWVLCKNSDENSLKP
ncbi:hypothetical protein [Membranihabitans maritimus]|uniref:hypothetical protein n=1 Tax=Membranihabitans maritimus TaxID=2904244 RepID=UPI001F3FE287|nr:hypothetical protein [Membranihabitans maritimus]